MMKKQGVLIYDDVFQIGCIGLCKAAAIDKGGTFSTYAYRSEQKPKRGANKSPRSSCLISLPRGK